MNNLNFKNWLENLTQFTTKLRGQQGTVPRGISQYQVRDLRTSPYGPFTGFRDTPSLPTRIGSDLLHGVSNAWTNIRDDSTMQPVRPTYDITRDFRMEKTGKLAIIEQPWPAKDFLETDESGNFLDQNGKPTKEISKAKPKPPEETKRVLKNILNKHILTNKDIINQLHAKNIDISSLSYVDSDEIPDNQEMVLLKFAGRVFHDKQERKKGIANPVHSFNYDIKGK